MKEEGVTLPAVARALARSDPLVSQPDIWTKAIAVLLAPNMVQEMLTRVRDSSGDYPSDDFVITSAFRSAMTRRQREELRFRAIAFTLIATPPVTASRRKIWVSSMLADHRRLIKLLAGVVTGVVILALGLVALAMNSARTSFVEIDLLLALIGGLMALYSLGEYQFQRWVFQRERALHCALDMIFAGKPVSQIFNDDGTLRF